MKTLIEKLFAQFEMAAQPAGGILSKVKNIQSKRKSSKQIPMATLSPECYNLRGLSKKAGDVRRTPAP